MKLAEFAKEVKLEAAKISWPTRKETMLVCSLVIVATVIAGVFFLAIDSLIYKIIQFILGV